MTGREEFTRRRDCRALHKNPKTARENLYAVLNTRGTQKNFVTPIKCELTMGNRDGWDGNSLTSSGEHAQTSSLWIWSLKDTTLKDIENRHRYLSRCLLFRAILFCSRETVHNSLVDCCIHILLSIDKIRLSFSFIQLFFWPRQSSFSSVRAVVRTCLKYLGNATT